MERIRLACHSRPPLSPHLHAQPFESVGGSSGIRLLRPGGYAFGGPAQNVGIEHVIAAAPCA